MSLVAQALLKAELGDARRNERASRIVSSIIEGQTSDTNATPGSGRESPWAHSIGSFRFFNNERVSLGAIYDAARSSLRALIPVGSRCFVAHDFSVVDYTQHNDKKDRVQVGNERGRGYDLYAALVLDAAGRPLGPLGVELRNERGCLSSESCEVLPFVDHYEQVQRGIAAATHHLRDREIVHLMDREFDDVALLRFLHGEHGTYVVRAQHLARVVHWRGRPIKIRELSKLLPLVEAGEVERDGKHYERRVGETIVTFQRPSLRGHKRGCPRREGPAIDVRVVLTELRGIGHREHHTWLLLTNLQDHALDVVKAYLARWRIERFFYLTKIGLRLERWRQQSGEAIARRLALTMLAAMVVYQLLIAKDDPSVRAIATLGGWLGRKGDHLGPVIMMRGAFVIVAGLSAVAQHGVDGLVQLAEHAGLGFALPASLRDSARAPPFSSSKLRSV